MTFTKNDKLKALAIVSVFETSQPFGDYAACVVLDDGAGVSYGICQFTHRSGSLAEVVEPYIQNGGKIGVTIMAGCRSALRDTSAASIERLAANAQFRNALRAAAITREMKAAQNGVATERYLAPAIALCDKLGFTLPLSLAVVYDSLVHGSFYRVARGVAADRNDEQAWITAYVRRRDAWLASYPRLTATRYRTRFFLNQIAVSNWALRLPINVHGVRLSSESFTSETAVEPLDMTTVRPTATTPTLDTSAANSSNAQPPSSEPSVLESIGAAASSALKGFDQVESSVNAVVTRTDAAKSLWTTVVGTLWQAVWAVAGSAAGLPHAVWITVAIICGLLTFFYLYRQITLGRIREKASMRTMT